MLEFNGKEFSYLKLVSAKLKNGELATYFRTLTSYDLASEEAFLGIYGEINPLLLLEKFVNHFNHEYAGYRKNTAHALLAWREVLANMPAQYPIYVHESGDNLSLNHLQHIELNRDFTPELSFQLFEDERFFRLEPRIRLPENSYTFSSKNILLSPFFVIHNNQLYPINNPAVARDIQHYEQNPKMLFIKSQKIDFQEKVLQPLSQRYRIQSKHFASKKPTKKAATSSLKTPIHQKMLLKNKYIFQNMKAGFVFRLPRNTPIN